VQRRLAPADRRRILVQSTPRRIDKEKQRLSPLLDAIDFSFLVCI
jgi:hypothetical protein